MKTHWQNPLILLATLLSPLAYALPVSISLEGSGTIAAAAQENCQSSPSGCTFTMTGTLASENLDSSAFASALTSIWITPPDPEEPVDPKMEEEDDIDCSSANGGLIITTADGSTVTAYQNGSLCFVPSADKETSPQIFNGSFYVLRGTGFSTEAKAMGRVTSSIDEDNNVLIMLDGLLP